MFPHRIQAPSQADLELQVSARLEADDQAQVIVQFAKAEQYDGELLSQLDTLCAVSYTHLTLPTIYSV